MRVTCLPGPENDCAATFIAFGRLELELEWCERKILLSWLELELVAGVV